MPRTILLADDSVTIRKVVELTFSDTDIRVDAVGSGQEALQRLREISPDLVLADVVMPGPTGYEICRAVKASSRPVPVLLLTGTFEPFDAALAKACGSDGHVTKPFDSRSLVERVEALLAHGGAGAAAAPDETDFEAMFDGLAAPKAPEPARPLKEEAPTRVASPPPPASSVAPVKQEAPAHSASPPPAASREVAPGRAVAQAPAVATPAAAPGLSPADVDAIARAVVEKLSDAVLREIAWDVVPDVAEIVVRERLRELERDDREPS